MISQASSGRVLSSHKCTHPGTHVYKIVTIVADKNAVHSIYSGRFYDDFVIIIILVEVEQSFLVLVEAAVFELAIPFSGFELVFPISLTGTEWVIRL